jgi:putative FmdB family regulatory protein
MPMYTYQCPRCGTRVERFQRIAELDRVAVRCTVPGCRGTPRRVIGAAPAVHFRGTGFYSTDHRFHRQAVNHA